MRREKGKEKGIGVGEEAKSQKTEGKTEGQGEREERRERKGERERVETERGLRCCKRANGLCLQGCSFDSHVAVVS